MRKYFWQGALLLLLGAPSCTRQAPSEDIVARVDGEPLTMDMVRRQLDTSRGVSELQVRMYTGRWVSSELLFQEAKRQGLDNSEEVRRGIDEAKKELAVAALLQKEIFTDSPSDIPYEDVTRYFTTHKEEFELPDDVAWISFAVFTEREPAAEFRRIVLQGDGWEAGIKGLKGNTAFVTNTDSVFYKQTTLFPPELWKVATNLGDDEVSFPVRTGSGYFVLQMLGRFDRGSTAPLAYVQDDIRNRLLVQRRQQRYADYLESLRERHAVQINLTGMTAGTDTTLPGGE